MGLPARFGGLDHSKRSSTFYENSRSITAPIVNVIIDQSTVSPPEIKLADINAKNQPTTYEDDMRKLKETWLQQDYPQIYRQR